MSMTSRIVNAFRSRPDRMARPRPGVVIGSEPLQQWRDYPADGLVPSRLVSILRSADEGVVDEALALFEEMEEKDAHLYAVANTRRLSVTGLPWQVVSASDVREGVDRVMADEVADYGVRGGGDRGVRSAAGGPFGRALDGSGVHGISVRIALGFAVRRGAER